MASPPHAHKGSVVICLPSHDRIMNIGELSAETFVYEGAHRYLCDCECRGTVRILDTGLRVCSGDQATRDVLGRWLPNHFCGPSVIDGVSISNGDDQMALRTGELLLRSTSRKSPFKSKKSSAPKTKCARPFFRGGDPVEANLKYRKF